MQVVSSWWLGSVAEMEEVEEDIDDGVPAFLEEERRDEEDEGSGLRSFRRFSWNWVCIC